MFFVTFMFIVKQERDLSDSWITYVFLSKTENPMQDVILSCRDQSLTAVKNELLRNCIPVSRR